MEDTYIELKVYFTKCISGCFSITSLTISSSVTSIGDNAFEACNALTSLIIPPSITVFKLSEFKLQIIKCGQSCNHCNYAYLCQHHLTMRYFYCKLLQQV